MTPDTCIATLRRHERSLRALVKGLVAAPYRPAGLEVARLGVLVALHRHGAPLARRDAVASARAKVERWVAAGEVCIRTEAPAA